MNFMLWVWQWDVFCSCGIRNTSQPYIFGGIMDKKNAKRTIHCCECDITLDVHNFLQTTEEVNSHKCLTWRHPCFLVFVTVDSLNSDYSLMAWFINRVRHLPRATQPKTNTDVPTHPEAWPSGHFPEPCNAIISSACTIVVQRTIKRSYNIISNLIELKQLQ